MSKVLFAVLFLSAALHSYSQTPGTRYAYWLSDGVVPGYSQYNQMDADQAKKIRLNRVKTRRQYTINETTGKRDKIADYTYDVSGNLTRFLIVQSRDTSHAFECYSFRYNSKNQLVQECDSDMGHVTNYEFFYNADGRRSKVKISDKSHVVYSFTYYRYDALNRLTVAEYRDGKNKVTDRHIFEYNAQGLVSSEYSVFDGIRNGRVDYAYTESGRLRRRSIYNQKGSDTIANYYVYRYDSASGTVETKWYDVNGTLYNTSVNTFDSSGNLVGMSYESRMTSSTTQCFYDENGLEVRETHNGNTEHYTLLVYEYYSTDAIKPSAPFVLRNVVFASGKSALLPGPYIALDSLADYLLLHPGMSVEISGHTDNVGEEEANQKLSEDRAKSVADYLVAKGIDRKRITYVGSGSSQPVAPNESEEGRLQNRRVEFVLKGE